VGDETNEPPVWEITEDVINQAVTVKVYEGGASLLPDGTRLFISEQLEMTAYHHDPAHARIYNRVIYHLHERGYETLVTAAGTIRSTLTDFHVDARLNVSLNGSPFFEKSWLESISRQLL
jgi:hypothetical protein